MKYLKKLSMFGTGALGAAAITFGAAGVAGAQDSEPTVDDPAPIEETVEETVEDTTREERQEQREARRAEKLAAIAEVLDIAVEDIIAAREDGSSLAEIAGDDLPALVDLFTERATERIEARVEAGRITQEQADERLEGLDERIQDRLENSGERDGRNGRKGARNR